MTHTDLQAAVASWVAQELEGTAPEPLSYWASFHMNSTFGFAVPELTILLAWTSPDGSPAFVHGDVRWPPDEAKVRETTRNTLQQLRAYGYGKADGGS